MRISRRIFSGALSALIMLASVFMTAAMPVPLAAYPSDEIISPRVIVERCIVVGGGLVSGSVCDVRVTLRNTGTSLDVSSVLVTGRWQGDSAPPVSFEQSNQVYVSSIGPTQTRDVVFSLKTQSVNISSLDAVSMNLDISYSYEGSSYNTNSVILRIPVKEEKSAEPVTVEPPETANEGWLLDSVPLIGALDERLVYAAGSAVCMLAAISLIFLRIRKK